MDPYSNSKKGKAPRKPVVDMNGSPLQRNKNTKSVMDQALPPWEPNEPHATLADIENLCARNQPRAGASVSPSAGPSTSAPQPRGYFEFQQEIEQFHYRDEEKNGHIVPAVFKPNGKCYPAYRPTPADNNPAMNAASSSETHQLGQAVGAHGQVGPSQQQQQLVIVSDGWNQTKPFPKFVEPGIPGGNSNNHGAGTAQGPNLSHPGGAGMGMEKAQQPRGINLPMDARSPPHFPLLVRAYPVQNPMGVSQLDGSLKAPESTPKKGGELIGPLDRSARKQDFESALGCMTTMAVVPNQGPDWPKGFPINNQALDPADPNIHKIQYGGVPFYEISSGKTGLPDISTALDPRYFPFIPLAAMARHPSYGVVKISNIPYNVERSGIIAAIGRNAKILNDPDESVHIIMDRITSKTNDAYIEFVSMEEAMKAIERFNASLQNKAVKIGTRPVRMELSSQPSLMKDLFPHARNVRWNGCDPEILPHHTHQNFGNFQGFVTEEEMIMLVKHVETPIRSNYSKDCPQRPFECLISTLKKLPWHYGQGITIAQRYAVHKATLQLITLLKNFIEEGRDETRLTPQLLKRLVRAGMSCAGFTVVQKDDIAFVAGMDEMEARSHGQPQYAAAWVHLTGVGIKPNMPLDLVEFYIAIIRQETKHMTSLLPPSVRRDVEATHRDTDGYFGYFWLEVAKKFGKKHFDSYTISQVANMELACVERVLRRALG